MSGSEEPPRRSASAGWWLAGVALTLGGCGNTVDVFGAQSDGGSMSGGASGSGMSGTGSSTTSTGAGSGSGSGSGSGGTATGLETTDGTGLDPTGTTQLDCSRLDLVFVIDNTLANGGVSGQLLANASALAFLLTDPTQPWSDDFHVGMVPTRDAGDLASCRVVGAMSLQPDPAGPVCRTATGEPWATEQDDDLVGTLQCLGTMANASEGPRGVAQAAARALSRDPPRDPGAAEVSAACNDGFVRDDGLKVIVVVTSDDDLGSPGEPDDWADWLAPLHDVAAGSELVVTAVLPTSARPGVCDGPASRLLQWLRLETNTITSDWCTFSGLEPVALAVELEQTLMTACGT